MGRLKTSGSIQDDSPQKCYMLNIESVSISGKIMTCKSANATFVLNATSESKVKGGRNNNNNKK